MGAHFTIVLERTSASEIKNTSFKTSKTIAEETYTMENPFLAWHQWHEIRNRELDGQNCTVTALYKGRNPAYNNISILKHDFKASVYSPLYVPKDIDLAALFYAAPGFEPYWKALRSAMAATKNEPSVFMLSRR